VENAIVGCLGKKGWGKTTWLKHHAQRCRRAIFADPERKWPVLPQRGDVAVRGGEALLNYLFGIGASDPAIPFRVVYWDDFEPMQYYAAGAALLIRNCTLVVDEISWLSKRTWLPQQLARIPQFGREPRVNLLYTSRQVQEVNDMLLGQADLLVVFHTERGKGLQHLADYVPPEIVNEAPLLKLHEFRTRGDRRIVQLLGAEGLARLPAPHYPFAPQLTR
jgi:hypothetical protein